MDTPGIIQGLFIDCRRQWLPVCHRVLVQHRELILQAQWHPANRELRTEIAIAHSHRKTSIL